MEVWHYKKYSWILISLISLVVSIPCFADAPFITTDPETTEYGHLQVYVFSILNKSNVANEEPFLFAPAFEADIGALPNFQLHLLVPHAWALPIPGVRAANGAGDVETGFKYRFIEEKDDLPQISITPLFELPTGDPNRYLGNGKMWMQLPIWLEKSWGDWKSYGGGGYVINPDRELNNYPFAGWEIERKFDKLTLGIEAFTQGAVAIQSRPYTLINAGGFYDITKKFSVLFSSGHSVLGEDHFLMYFGLYWET